MSTGILLNVKDLAIDYQTNRETVHAVNKISFSLRRKETLGFVGETGAGKTTTALSLLRLLPHRTAKILSGSIAFNGVNILNINEKEMRNIRGKKIAMIFQDPMTALNPTMTVGEQIAEALLLHNDDNKSTEEIHHKVEEVLMLVGISPDRKNEYPHQFSGGMKQRVVIAIALVCEPELLIADEPTTALDVTIQMQILSMMKNLKNKFNMSMIMVTHDLGIIADTCDNVAVMYAGQIIEYGSIYDIFEKERHHPYTVGLFGSIPDLDTESKRLNPIAGLMPDPTNLPEGCKFADRCSFRQDICLKYEPPLYQEGTHSIKCFLYNSAMKEN